MEPKCNADYEFNSRRYGNPIYNQGVERDTGRFLDADLREEDRNSRTVHRVEADDVKRPLPVNTLVARMALIFAVGLGLTLLLIPRPLRALHYMVAGSVATALALAGGFAMLRLPGADRPLLRIRIARSANRN
jgi:hypothetical protein